LPEEIVLQQLNLIPEDGPVALQNRRMLDQVNEQRIFEELELVDLGRFLLPNMVESVLEKGQMIRGENAFRMKVAMCEEEFFLIRGYHVRSTPSVPAMRGCRRLHRFRRP
jgi:hypothetical protein